MASAATHRRHVVAIASTPSTHPLRTAIMEPYLFPGDQQAQAFSVARRTGATYARMAANWASIAPSTLPASGFDPTDPDSPYYNWASLDGEVEAAEKVGMTPILDIGEAPPWALSIARQGLHGGGTPDISALAAFAHALASHYDGSDGPPAVHVFQIWNEPNLSLDLDPVDPDVYRSMVNAAAAQIHGVDPSNIVVAGALDPFKNKAKRFYTVAPLAFMRKLLCVSSGAHPHATCNDPVDFDAWSHHPYTFGGPFGHARLADDVSLGDLPRMAKLLDEAEQMHHIVSAHKVEFWVTEFAWDTDPPNPHALPMYLQARGTAEALHQMWLSGVSLATWFLLQDHPLSKDPYQCGLYFRSKWIVKAKAKPTLTAFRFPFVAYRHGGTISLWGRDATSTKQLVTIQLRHGATGAWQTIARIRSNLYGIFLENLRIASAPTDWLRAIAPGSGKSLPFSLTQPVYPHIGPWGN